MYKYISVNNLLPPNQSGFCSGDSCINQLLSITHDIYYSFDEGFETRAIFLDISKAFDKVWHKGHIHKLRQYRFSGDLLSLLIEVLTNREQRVVLNGQDSSWADIKADIKAFFASVTFHKHLGLILDSNFYFNEHINTVLSKVNKMIALLRKFQHILPRHSILTIYKTFVRPHLDYGDVVYEKVFYEQE